MRQWDCREAIHPPNHVLEGRLLGRVANARGGAECRAPTARGRAVCGRTACTVQRAGAGDGATACEGHGHRASPLLYCSLMLRLIEQSSVVVGTRRKPALVDLG